jgi:uncharacterized membrane protein YgdD (TMEM256/DUF423 family)
MNQRATFITGGLLAALAVAIGAFGAHGLKNILVENNRTETFELAVKYQFYHSLALLVTALTMVHFGEKRLSYASLLFVCGILLFSGSLFILSLTGVTRLGAVTPLGGVAFIAGWIMFILAVAGKKRIS